MDPTTPDAPNPALVSAEPVAAPQIPLLPPEELKQLARDIFAEKVFLDRVIYDYYKDHFDPQRVLQTIQSVFLTVGLIGEPVYKLLHESEGMLYEYWSEAGERTVNGWPMFMSFKLLHGSQLPLLAEYLGKLQTAAADL